MNIKPKAKKAGALAAIIAILILVFAGMMSIGLFTKTITVVKATPPKPVVYPADHLSIDASYLLKTDETNDSVNVSCDLYMTNIWEKESGEIKATAYVSEKNTNLAVYKSTVEFGVIDANSTKELNIPVKFSDNSYKVEILLFEKNKLFKKVTLSITTYQNYYYGFDGSMVINKGRTLDDCEEGQWSIQSEPLQVTSVN